MKERKKIDLLANKKKTFDHFFLSVARSNNTDEQVGTHIKPKQRIE